MNEPPSILNRLISLSQKDRTQFHVPSHTSGNAIFPEFIDFIGNNLFKLDQTELDELDNLSYPTGIIKDVQERIANVYNCQQSFMLINGSTSGIMATLTSILNDNSRVIVARNCHKSVVSTLILTGAEPIWVMPKWNSVYGIFESINPLIIEETIKQYNQIDAVMITSPTYEGICSDIKEISKICKKYRIPLIVDEAHGGHFIFSDILPESSVNLGADAVIQSTHKTCTSLTQSSLLHIPHDSLLNISTISETLNLYNSSSPSYILLSSIESAISYMSSIDGKKRLDDSICLSREIRNKLGNLENISVFNLESENLQDVTKIILSLFGINGNKLAEILEIEHSIYIETCNNMSIMAQVNIGNSKDNINNLYNAISNIKSSNNELKEQEDIAITIPNQVIKPRKAFFSKSERILAKNAIGRISRYCYTKCPPGYPFLIPGEQIADHHVKYFMENEFIEVAL